MKSFSVLEAVLALIATSQLTSAQSCNPFPLEPLSVATGQAPIAVAIGDLDSDGDNDMAVSNAMLTSGIQYHGFEGVHVVLNLGDGSFGAPVFYPCGVSPNSMAMGDLNGDGHLDLVTAELGTFNYGLDHWVNYGVNVLFNQGDGTFGAPVMHAFDANHSEPRSADVGDIDGDGDIDVVASVEYAGYQLSAIAVLINDGAGNLADPVYYVSDVGSNSIALGDIDGDGQLDAVTANTAGHSASRFHGNGDGTFTRLADLYAGQYPKSVTLDDFNGDGIDDIAISNHYDVRFFYSGGGGGGPYSTGLRPAHMGAGDVDGDGDIDAIVPNTLGDSVTLMTNMGTGVFTLTVIATGNGPFAAAIGDLDGDGNGEGVISFLAADYALVLPNACAPPCSADLDGSGAVDVLDLLQVLESWGTCDSSCPQDLDGDGLVDVADLLAVLANWGSCG